MFTYNVKINGKFITTIKGRDVSDITELVNKIYGCDVALSISRM
jgi:hypothetical protein